MALDKIRRIDTQVILFFSGLIVDGDKEIHPLAFIYNIFSTQFILTHFQDDIEITNILVGASGIN